MTKQEPTDFAEVWQDVVSKQHLLLSTTIGVALGMACYLQAYATICGLKSAIPEDLIKGYALFFGSVAASLPVFSARSSSNPNAL